MKKLHTEDLPTANRHGAILMQAAFCMVIIVAALAFSIDFGHIVLTQSELQNAADAGALSGVRRLSSGRSSAIAAAKTWAGKNVAATQFVAVTDADVELGSWDKATAVFTVIPSSSTASPNAVRVTCRRTAARGNAIQLFFAPMMGTSTADTTASAIAVAPRGIGTRFLIDNEMFDTGIPAIQALAQSTGKNVDTLLRPRGFNQGKKYNSSSWTWTDNFLDFPTGSTVDLPTGQGTSYSNNDAGLFDINHTAFPFSNETSFMQFLMYSESGNDNTKWGTDLSTVKSKLDPLNGIAPVTDSSLYSSYVDPDFIHVSPVYFSDVNTLGMSGSTPRVNALGLRRGLVAFKIIAVGQDIDGSGSVLPKLRITFVDPALTTPADVMPIGPTSSTGTPTLVE